MATQNGFPTDTRLRTLAEVMTRLIKPIPPKLVSKTETGDFVNVTNLKDLLDWACGFGRWRAEVIPHPQPVVQTFYTAKREMREGWMYCMTVRLSIQVADDQGGAVWHSQDGTGTELLSGPQVYGDALTNAYAQGLRRAAESFGLARELWRRDKKKVVQYTKAQMAARDYIIAHPDGGVTEELPRAEEHAEEIAAERARETERDYQLDDDRSAGPAPTAAPGPVEAPNEPPPAPASHTPPTAADAQACEKARKMLANLAEKVKTALAQVGKAVNGGQLQMIETRGGSLAKRLRHVGIADFDIHNWVERETGRAVHNLNFEGAKLIIDTLSVWLKTPAKGGGAKK